MTQNQTDYDQALFEKLKHTELFATYQDAFRSATGLPLRFVGAEVSDWCLDDEKLNRSAFCEAINLCGNACAACVETNRQLMIKASAEGPSTCHCFAGVAATAIPVRCGKRLVGFLKTGQVFNRVPTPASFAQVSKTLRRHGLAKVMSDTLEKVYLETRDIAPERYQSMITLLATFAEQLSTLAEKLILMNDGNQPVAIAKACEFIDQNLSEPLPLALVARHAGLSESHFCRVFREGTGMTLTDYVNRCRIQWAKKELLKTDTRISEIAFLVGYQSLSQFNRSFARVTGRSPSQFRAEELISMAS